MRYGLSGVLFLCLICSGCGQSETGSSKIDYDETKKMLVDILKTDEGKKAIEDVLKDEKMKSELIMDQAAVKETIESTLVSDKGKAFWKDAFSDPKFAEAYAKGLRSEHEKLLKDLAKDADYRSMIMDMLKEPEMAKEIKSQLKTKEMRKIYKDTMIEALESPLVKAQIEDLLIKAVKEQGNAEKEKEKESK